MADEAKVVGVARGVWAAACSRCNWIYGPAQCREVDMAMRGHCRSCGGDVVGMSVPGREVKLRLERDTNGEVVRGTAPEVILAQEVDCWARHRNRGIDDA